MIKKKTLSISFIFSLLLLFTLTCYKVYASEVILRGLKFDSSSPQEISFLVDAAGKELGAEDYEKLIRYFLAALTMPEDDLWVNLSPYESNRIMNLTLAKTELGKLMLEQDLQLKSRASMLTNPSTELGKVIWNVNDSSKIAQALSKVWISPKEAHLFETESTVWIDKSSLKVESNSTILAQDYLPSLEFEVNKSKGFAELRQAYNSIILATWFKNKYSKGFFESYLNQKNIRQIDLAPIGIKEKVYDKYLFSFNNGEYDIVMKTTDSNSGRLQKEKYLAGGINFKVQNDVDHIDEESMASAINQDCIEIQLRIKELVRQEMPKEGIDPSPLRDKNRIKSLLANVKQENIKDQFNAALEILKDTVDHENKDARLQALQVLMDITLPLMQKPRVCEGQLDLHGHDVDSDGFDSATYKAFFAYILGLKGFALTNHDMVPTLEAVEAVEIINNSIEKYNEANNKEVKELIYIPGVEIATFYEGVEVHVLVYLPDFFKESYKEKLEALKPYTDKLKTLGENIEESVKSSIELANKSMPGFEINLADLKKYQRTSKLCPSLMSDAMFYKYTDKFLEMGIDSPKAVWYNHLMINGVGAAYKDKMMPYYLTMDDVRGFVLASGGSFAIAHPNEINDKAAKVNKPEIFKEIISNILDETELKKQFLSIERYSHKSKKAGLIEELANYNLRLKTEGRFEGAPRVVIEGISGSDSHNMFSAASFPFGLTGVVPEKGMEVYNQKQLRAILGEYWERYTVRDIDNGGIEMAGIRDGIELSIQTQETKNDFIDQTFWDNVKFEFINKGQFKNKP